MAFRIRFMKNQIKDDAALIDALGGAAKLAHLLGFAPEVGTQRVHNWKKRGIPARVKLDHPEIFVPNPTDGLPAGHQDREAA